MIKKFLSKITFVIVSYNSGKIIGKCLDCLPKESKIIIIENANNKKILNNYKRKKNIRLICNSLNNGYGAGNNIGIKLTKTQYAFVISPDTFLKKKIFKKIENSIKKLKNNFWLLGIENITNSKNNLIESKYVGGHAMLLNLKKFKKKKVFDENYFLYNEEIDLCLDIKRKGGKIFSLDTNDLKHLGKMSSGEDNLKMKVLRNWHGYWSYIYFYKKNYGNLKANYIFLKKLIGAFTQYSFGLIFFNKEKSTLNKFKFLALISAILSRPSSLRLEHIKI